MTLEICIKNFIDRESKGPFLLALSGGPDSIALFHLFVGEKVLFHVAHVNHNWRPESGHEEIALKDLCHSYEIPFHSKSLFPDQLEGNLEDVCRKERLKFFREVVENQKLLGIVMGHHGDDLAETVLKRVFEGASLARLKGLSVKSHYESMTVFRPLLKVRKKDILQWLENQGHFYFVDSTNQDTTYLRNRMRIKLIPEISEHFGKEIHSSLIRISQASEELEEFLENFLEPYRKKMVVTDEGISLDLSSEEISTTFAWKMIVKDFFSRNGLTPSMSTLEMMIYLLRNGKGIKQIVVSNRYILISKKKISISSKQLIVER